MVWGKTAIHTGADPGFEMGGAETGLWGDFTRGREVPDHMWKALVYRGSGRSPLAPSPKSVTDITVKILFENQN